MSNRAYSGSSAGIRLPQFNLVRQRKLFIGLVLVVALLAFEIFNFDTTQFALQSLLGDVKFIGILWATILAIAFCSIDFAGLIRLFTPEKAAGGQREVWYLMGAWLLGATMNAVMTWWAVSLTLLNNNFGNEILSREQLLRYVPIFVAVLVWLTRILFIGAFSIAGEQLFGGRTPSRSRNSRRTSSGSAKIGSNRSKTPARLKAKPKNVSAASSNRVPAASSGINSPPPPPPQNSPRQGQNRRVSRVRQRPPVPNSSLRHQSSIQARSNN